MKQSEFINTLIAAIKENKKKFGWTDADIVGKILEMEDFKNKTLDNLLEQLI